MPHPADEQPRPMFRVGTWNMDHWKRAVEQRRAGWSTLHALGIDAALLQEAVVPASVDRIHVVSRPIAGTRPWGSAVVSLNDAPLSEVQAVVTKYSSRGFAMLGTYPGTTIVAACEVAGFGRVTLVSVYGMIDVYAQTTMLRIIADLVPLFDSPAGEHVVLGGDFNLSTCSSPSKTERVRHEAILRTVESLGLIAVTDIESAERPSAPPTCSCGRTPCRHIATYRGGTDGAPLTQLDYLYATRELASRCRRVRLADLETRGLSDHVPLIAEFDVSEPLSRTAWDTDSFVAFLSERHGTAESTAAHQIFEWACDLSAKLRATGTRARLDRLPFSSGTEPEVFVQLDLQDPEALQWTFSLRADAAVVVQLQRLRPPFGTNETRAELCRELNSVLGGALDARLRGRPSFPLSLLDAARMPRFLEIWSRVVQQSVRDRTPQSAPSDALAE